MKSPNRFWYLLVAIVALVPFGLRALTWATSRPQAIDLAMAQQGRTLFEHEWTPNDPLCPGGDGLGPVFNGTSCVECHRQGGIGGSGGINDNITTFTVRNGPLTREGVVHAQAVGVSVETLAQVNPVLPATGRLTLAMLTPQPGCVVNRIHFPPGVHVSQRNTPALFGAKLIDELPDRAIIANERYQQIKWAGAPADGEALPVGRALRLANGRVGHFGWKAQTAGLAEFVQAACANELGLGNPNNPQPRPLTSPSYEPPGLDLTLDQCNQLTAFCASLPRPVEVIPDDPAVREQAETGKGLFRKTGCADCHTPDLGPVDGIYSDLLLHQMGEPLVGGGSYGEPPVQLPKFPPGAGPSPGEWRTPPLWGVADSAPYLHDGRAATLTDAIQQHAGQGTRAARAFGRLQPAQQAQLIAFLKTLRAPG